MKLAQRLPFDEIQKTLVRGSIGSLAVRSAGLAAALGAEVLLTRRLGTAGYGVYSFVLSWLAVIAVGLKLGLDAALVRCIASYRAAENWDLLKGIISWSFRLVAGFGLAAALALWLVTTRSGLLQDAQVKAAFAVGCLILPLIPLLALRESSLQGLKRPALSLFSSRILLPLTLTVSIAAYYLAAGAIDSRTALYCLFIAHGAAVLFSSAVLFRSLPEAARRAEPEFRRGEWTAVGAGMLFVSGQYLIFNRIDIIMLEPLAGKSATGIYSAAVRLAWLVSFFVQAVSVIAAPLISELHSGKRKAELHRMVHLAVSASSACSALVFIALVIAGKFALGIFGPEFVAGYRALVILCAAQFFNAVTGPSGFLLTMTGHEKQLAVLLSLALALNVILNYLLIPLYGIEGAAMATGISTIFWNALAALLIRRRLGIIPVVGLSHLGPYPVKPETHKGGA